MANKNMGKYAIYLAWAALIGYIFWLVQPHSKYGAHDLKAAVMIGLFSAAAFKRFLPFLKDKQFPEISSRRDMFLSNLRGVLIKPKQCSVCHQKTNFPVVVGYKINKQLYPGITKGFCRLHGMEELQRLLEAYPGTIVFQEPGVKQDSGSFFYQPDDLKVHQYSAQDKDALEKILREYGTATAAILWIANDIIGICQDTPLFKKSTVPESITRDELRKRLSAAIEKLEIKYKKGEYCFAEPRGAEGIYIWDGEI
jgi:hypothetical protein